MSAECRRVSLRIKSTEKGTLLIAEEHKQKAAVQLRPKYLAYDATGKSAEVRLVDEPDIDCHWAYREGQDQTRYLRLLEVRHFKIPNGPRGDWELRYKDGRLFVAKPGTEVYERSQWVGTFVEYDNLDDGK